MDLFELLFIAIFILFPILEGVLKQRRKGRGGPVDEGEREAGADRSEEEPRSAADMVPDDFWEIMTGERREAEPSTPTAEGGAPWEETGGRMETATTEPESDDTLWEPEPWMDDSSVSREPVSLEYEGPEAYSLETPAPPPVERKVPSAEARHRAFHALVDRPRPKRTRDVSPLVRSLRSREGLRQAVLLKEVLGPPKGLD